MRTTCGKTERTGRHLSAAAVSGAGSSSTFPAFPEIGTVRDSRNFRNDPGEVEEWKRGGISRLVWWSGVTRGPLFLGAQEEREKGGGGTESHSFVLLLMVLEDCSVHLSSRW